MIAGLLYSMLGLGFAMVYRTTRIFHMAYSLLFILSAYFIFSCVHDFHLPFFVAALVSMTLVVLSSSLIEVMVYRPLVNRDSNTLIIFIASLGVWIIGVNVIALFYGSDSRLLNPNISGSVSIGNLILTYPQIAQASISLVLIFLVSRFTNRHIMGLSIKALASNAELCKFLGLDVTKIRLYVFALSGLIVAISGILHVYDTSFTPHSGMNIILYSVVAMIIGGNRNSYSILYGGLILGVVQGLSFWIGGAIWKETFTYLLLILILIFKPEGVFSKKSRSV